MEFDYSTGDYIFIQEQNDCIVDLYVRKYRGVSSVGCRQSDETPVVLMCRLWKFKDTIAEVAGIDVA